MAGHKLRAGSLHKPVASPASAWVVADTGPPPRVGRNPHMAEDTRPSDSQQCSRAPPGLVHVGTAAVGCAHGREARIPGNTSQPHPAHSSLHMTPRALTGTKPGKPHMAGLVGAGDTGIAHKWGVTLPERVCGQHMEGLWVRNPQVPSEEPLGGLGASPCGIPSSLATMALSPHALSMGRWEMGPPCTPRPL